MAEPASMTPGSRSLPELVCPIDELPLERSEIELRCPNAHRWAIRRGIPRMIPSGRTYTDAFGLQWNTFTKTQLDSYTGTGITYERVRRCLGEQCWSELNGAAVVDVLEAGCGAGRFTEILLGTDRARVTSLDYSAAVDANQENFPQDERHRVIQADLRSAPFGAQFDVVLCLGVIQHTPDPEETIAALYRYVKPGGRLVIDHYTDDQSSWLGRMTRVSGPTRAVLKRLPAERSLGWTERLVRLFFPWHRATRDSRGLRRLLSRISPVLTYFHVHPELSDELQYEWALLDTYDSLTDYYKHKRTRAQIEAQLRTVGAVDIECSYGGNGVEARCRKPAMQGVPPGMDP